MGSIQSTTIFFITGAFVSNCCWDEWRIYFENKGYITIAPPWPHKEATAEDLRKQHPDPAIASIRLKQVVEHYTNIVKQLPEKPILIGHSLGGLITQLLLQQDLAAAGVAIHSVPPQGVMSLKFSFFRSLWGPLGFFTSVNKSFLMSFHQWQYAFTNNMSIKDQKASYNQFVIPESKKVLRDVQTRVAKIYFNKTHVPLLFLSGSEDHIIPSTLNYSNYKKYKEYNSVTDYKEFKGRNHLVFGQPPWMEEADFILYWLRRIK